MVYKRFRLNVLLRVGLLLLSLSALLWVITQTQWVVTGSLLILLILLQVWEFVRYAEKVNRDLSRFLLAIRHRDFTASFSDSGRGGSFSEVEAAFNEVIDQFQHLRAEKESHYQYLQMVVEHIGVALICFDEEGEVTLLNNAATHLLNKPYLKNISVLEKMDPGFYQAVKNMPSGQKRLIKTVVDGKLLHLAIHAIAFRMQDRGYTLVSLANIKPELEEKEIESYQKLIRVLTHEIMNSVTPIISLTGVINEMLDEDLDEEGLQDLQDSVITIENRSKGLLKFVQAYRNLTRIPRPNYELVKVEELFQQVQKLLGSDCSKQGVRLCIDLDDRDLIIKADRELIEQVLINLIKNAREAMAPGSEGEIKLSARHGKDSKVYLEVRDNGPGIPEEFIDQIFVPFFTSKKQGSGIGLSFSRQVMRLHKGSITVQTQKGQGSNFILEF